MTEKIYAGGHYSPLMVQLPYHTDKPMMDVVTDTAQRF